MRIPFETESYVITNYGRDRPFTFFLCSFVHLKNIYSYTNDYLKIRKEEFSRVSPHGLKWGNKPSQRRNLEKKKKSPPNVLENGQWAEKD